MKTTKLGNDWEKRMYSEAVYSAIDDAIELEIAFGTGADDIFEWATSEDGKNLLGFAGFDHSAGEAQTLKDCVLEGAQAKLQDIDKIAA